jgi:hypothetical protein
MNCPRCKRPVHPWPIGNRPSCSPKDWAHCIRNDLDMSVLAGTLEP